MKGESTRSLKPPDPERNPLTATPLDEIIPIIPMGEWGKDHWSTLVYVESRAVDHNGIPDLNHLRCNETRHPGLKGPMARVCLRSWQPEYGTRLKGFWLHTKPDRTDPHRQLPQHDDWDCIDDLEEAGCINLIGTGINPVIRLTDLGWELAGKVRRWKAEGKTFATFTV